MCFYISEHTIIRRHKGSFELQLFRALELPLSVIETNIANGYKAIDINALWSFKRYLSIANQFSPNHEIYEEVAKLSFSYFLLTPRIKESLAVYLFYGNLNIFFCCHHICPKIGLVAVFSTWDHIALTLL